MELSLSPVAGTRTVPNCQVFKPLGKNKSFLLRTGIRGDRQDCPGPTRPQTWVRARAGPGKPGLAPPGTSGLKGAGTGSPGHPTCTPHRHGIASNLTGVHRL